MNWKKSLFLGTLVVLTVFAMAGCGTTAISTSATVPTPSATQPNTTPARQTSPAGASINGNVLSPPSGNVTGERPTAPGMDLVAAAAKLSVTETQLREALGNTQPGLTDLAAAATKLGVSEDSLRQALGFSNNGTMPGGTPPGGSGPAGQGK